MKNLLYLILLLFVASLEAKTLIFGVVPQQSPIKLIQDWQPITNYLEKATGERIELKVEHSIPEFEKKLYSGVYDIAYMNPYHYVIASKRQGYIAEVRDEKNLIGILVVKKNSGLRDVSKLGAKTFLFPAPEAFAATLLTKYELLKKYKIDLEKNKNYLYVNSHDSVYKGIARDVGDVGGGIERTFNALEDSKSKDMLMILYRTKAYPSHPFALNPALSNAQKAKITKALIQMPQSLVLSIDMKHLIKIEDSEYDEVRDIAVSFPSKEE
ncbi:MAG: phosphate/phosphite/phosphonate ABC transporter substrate-binding protein [Thiovulaceae bacterium]|nr:phosphate/phosphite/phosphonate ABC transporter substrate-binding protein [Sulfurimonadaceae bacterium]